MLRIVAGLLVALVANTSYGAFSFKLGGAAGPGVISGPGTASVGGAGIYNVFASSNVGGGEVLNTFSLTLSDGSPNFTFAAATGAPNVNVTTDTLVGTFAFNHTGTSVESTTLFFSGVSTANGNNVFQFGSTNLNAVPEPSSLGLVLLGTVALVQRRRRV